MMRRTSRRRYSVPKLVVLSVAVLAAVVPPGPAGGEVDSHDPIGAVDSVSRGAGCVWHVYGWRADPDGGEPEPHVYADGERVGSSWMNEPRPDVAAVHPFASAEYAGFIAQPYLRCGERELCVTATNIGPGTDRSIGCRTLTDDPSPGDPIGHLDLVAPEVARVVVRGWAADPDGNNDDGLGIHVYLDGKPWLYRGQTGQEARPDVAAVHPWAGGRSGFDQVLPVLPGPHQVCVYALNEGRTGNNNTTLGCETVTVPAATATGSSAAFGSYDEITYTVIQGTGNTEGHARGWAYDPDATEPVLSGSPRRSASTASRRGSLTSCSRLARAVPTWRLPFPERPGTRAGKAPSSVSTSAARGSPAPQSVTSARRPAVNVSSGASRVSPDPEAR